MTILPLTTESARLAGQLRRELRARQADIGVADSLVAGICSSERALLLTGNREHFERAAGLGLGTLTGA
jgi:predicted nucleic acid-binding protein